MDSAELDSVDVVANLDQPLAASIGSELLVGGLLGPVKRWYVSHLVEHVANVLPLFEAMHELSTEDAVAVVRCPYGSSDDAFDDPTHVRRIFHGFWPYLGQPFYWRADYGYRGDWSVQSVQLRLRRHPEVLRLDVEDQMRMIERGRNLVDEQFVILRAVKPARQPLLVNQEALNVRLVMPDENYAWPSGFKEMMG